MASGDQAGGGQHAGFPRTDLVEQDLAPGFGGLEHASLPLDAHDIVVAALTLAVGDVAAAQAVELCAAEEITAILLFEFRKLRE